MLFLDISTIGKILSTPFDECPRMLERITFFLMNIIRISRQKNSHSTISIKIFNISKKKLLVTRIIERNF